jgi:SRSO17 transposase
VTPNQLRKIERQLDEWLVHVLDGMGRRERREALAGYLRGLLLEGERKSIEPIAERLVSDRAQIEAMRQRIQQAISVADWDEGTVFRRIAERAKRVLPELDAFVIDDTGFPKKGFKSVGVQRQYSGTMGRIDNCQIATSLHLASEHGGVCIGMRLYLPKDWASDPKRRARTGIPDDVQFEEKWKISLRLLDAARGWGLSNRVVVADAGYGDCVEFREQLEQRGMQYVLGVTGTAVAWPPGVMPIPPPTKRTRTTGRPRSRWRDPENGKAQPTSEIAAGLPSDSWRTITWRKGTRGPQSSRFAAVRIRTAHRHAMGAPPSDELWLLCEWPRRQDQPSKLYLSNLPAKTSLKKLVYLAKLRWRIERDYQEMKSELGLDHFEGRSWRGFHHHVACVAASHAFLAFQRVRFPPEDRTADPARVPPRLAARAPARPRRMPALPSGDRAAGAAVTVANVIE